MFITKAESKGRFYPSLKAGSVSDTPVQIFYDDFTDGTLSKWTNVDSAKIEILDSLNVLALQGYGGVVATISDAAPSPCYLSVSVSFCLEGADSILVIIDRDDDAPDTSKVIIDTTYWKTGVWYTVTYPFLSYTGNGDDFVFTLRGAQGESKSKTYVRKVEVVRQPPAYDITFSDSSWEQYYEKNADVSYNLTESGVLTMMATSLPYYDNDNDSALLLSRKESMPAGMVTPLPDGTFFAYQAFTAYNWCATQTGDVPVYIESKLFLDDDNLTHTSYSSRLFDEYYNGGLGLFVSDSVDGDDKDRIVVNSLNASAEVDNGNEPDGVFRVDRMIYCREKITILPDK